MSEAPVVLWQMPPAWGLPNPSPFCMKVETWLRMTGIPYVAKPIEGPPKSRSKKFPYIERPDGTLLSDSSAIIETLTRERGVTLDAWLSEQDRALGLLLQRTFEEELYFILLFERWLIDKNWEKVKPAYFGNMPWVVRKGIVPLVRRKVRAYAYGQGVARLEENERHRKGESDIRSIAKILGDKPYVLGRPSSFDAVAYAFLANLIWVPITSHVGDVARGQTNLVSYCERMKAAYFGDSTAG